MSLTLPWPHARALGSETLPGHLEMPLSFQSAWSCQLCCLGTSKPHIGMGLWAGPEVPGLSIPPACCCMWLIPLRSCYIPEAGMGSCSDGIPHASLVLPSGWWDSLPVSHVPLKRYFFNFSPQWTMETKA